MAITAKAVADLRQKTGLGMMECKQALSETNGDEQKAIDLLRTRGIAKMDTRTDRVAAHGRVGVALSADKSKAAIIELNTETDFTANNDQFKHAVNTVAQEALKQPNGAVNKSETIQAAIDNVRLTTKENAQFARGQVVGAPGSTVGSYVHFTGKVGVLVEVEGAVSDQVLNDLCMHVTAVSPTPLGINEKDIDPALIEKEKQIAKAQAIEQGKPEQIAEKMVTGKIRKFLEDHLLPQQFFIKDDKKRVQEILPKGVTIKSFVRFSVGEK